MDLPRPLLVGIAILLVVGYAVLSTVWTGHDPGWYGSLPRPAWQPPGWVFGVMWPLNFLALAGAGWLVTARAQPAASIPWLVVLAGSVVCALGWAYTFYVPHRLGAAAVLLGAAAVLTWVLAALAVRAVGWLGAILVPYAVWMSVATSLAIGYWRLIAKAAQ